MTSIKIDGTPATSARAALEPYGQALYATPGMRVLGVIELAHTERTQPAPDNDKEPSVKLQIKALEIANADQAETLRQAMQALYRHRTAYGTLDDQGDIQLSERTLELTGGMLDAIESARLRTGLLHWLRYVRAVQSTSKLSLSQARNELELIAKGLDRLLDPGVATPS